MKPYLTSTAIFFALILPSFVACQTSDSLPMNQEDKHELLSLFSFFQQKKYLVKKTDFSPPKYNQVVNDSLGQSVKHGKWYYKQLFRSINEVHIYTGKYDMGKKEGEWKKLVQKENLESYDLVGVDNYTGDYLNGESIRFNSLGTVFFCCNYKNGKLNGPTKYYSDNGSLIAINYFANGTHQSLDLQNPTLMNEYWSDIILNSRKPFVYILRNGCTYLNISLADANEPLCAECCE